MSQVERVERRVERSGHDDTRFELTHHDASELMPVGWEGSSLAQVQAQPRRAVWARPYIRNAMICDVLSAAIGVGTAAVARFNGEPRPAIITASVLIMLLWPLCVAGVRGYSARLVGFGSDEYASLGRAWLIMFTLIAMASYLLSYDLSRLFVLVALPVILVCSLIGRLALRTMLSRARMAGRALQRTLVVGHGHRVAATVRELDRAPAASGLHIVGVCASGLDPEEILRAQAGSASEVHFAGSPAHTLTAVDTLGVDVVVVCSDQDLSGRMLRRLSWGLAKRGIELYVAPGLADVAVPRLAVRPLGEFSLLHVERPIVGGFHLWINRAFDAVLATLINLVALPVMLAVALLIKLEDRGPVFFRQERVGVDGRPFEMLKFRSMVTDAEARLAQLEATAGNDVLFKHKHDPRITRIGRFLRRYSLDELPQLLNVLKGDMSLVGPRPPLPREVDEYEPDANERLRVRPGMTGLWQISGRSDLDWEQSLRLDLWYVDNWSPMLDLQILARTARAVIKGQGAY